MHPAKALIPLFFVLVFARPLLAADDKASFEELASAANSASDLSAAAPYQMDGIVNVYSHDKQVANGYFRFGRDRANSGEYLEFKDYREIAITNGNSLYVQRTPNVNPPVSSFLRDFQQSWKALFNQPAKATTHQPNHSSASDCFVRTFGKDATELFCFDLERKLLVSREIRQQTRIEKFTFSDYQTFASQQIPGAVQYFENGDLRFEAQIKKIVKAGFASGYFVPPPGAKQTKTCPDIQRAILVKRVDPDFPLIARAAHIQGRVRIAGTIDNEGKLTKMSVVSGHPTLAQAAIEALKDWRYVPAYCASGPVESETEIAVQFRM